MATPKNLFFPTSNLYTEEGTEPRSIATPATIPPVPLRKGDLTKESSSEPNGTVSSPTRHPPGFTQNTVQPSSVHNKGITKPTKHIRTKKDGTAETIYQATIALPLQTPPTMIHCNCTRCVFISCTIVRSTLTASREINLNQENGKITMLPSTTRLPLYGHHEGNSWTNRSMWNGKVSDSFINDSVFYNCTFDYCDCSKLRVIGPTFHDRDGNAIVVHGDDSKSREC